MQWIDSLARQLAMIGERHRYRLPTGPARHLSSEHFTPIHLTSTDADQASGELYNLWRSIPHGHKWHHYFATYAEVLERLGNSPVRMLEIGVFKGGSVKFWNRALPAGSIVVGIDLNPDCAQHNAPESRVHIRIGDQSDQAFLRGVIEEFGPFDFVLDDGSHRCSHMIASFDHLFLNGLRSPGIYLVEDTQTAFWTTFRDKRYSFVDLAKDLVDLMHSHYVKNQGANRFTKGHRSRITSTVVPRIASEIEEIQFRDSIVVIHKRAKSALPIVERL